MDDSVINKYHKQKIEEEIEEGIKHVQSVIENGFKHNHGKIIKTLPMKPEWKATYDELNKFTDEVSERGKALIRELRKMEQVGHYFWGRIAVELDMYGDMHINKNNEIEVFENNEDKDDKKLTNKK